MYGGSLLSKKRTGREDPFFMNQSTVLIICRDTVVAAGRR